jgi:hypothetical protein
MDMDAVQRSIARSSVRVTDGEGGSRGLNRPGFRLDARKVTRRNARGEEEGTYEEEDERERQTSDAAMRARDAAYRDYERTLTNAYKNPVGTDAAPYEQSAEEIVHNASTHTESARRLDARSVQQAMRDHAARMDQIYRQYDSAIRDAWRNT